MPHDLLALGTGILQVLSLVSGRSEDGAHPHYVTSEDLRLFSVVNSFSEPVRKKMQNVSCPSPRRAEVQGTPVPPTH